MAVKTQCPECKREVETQDGTLCTHGPGHGGEFICPGSGDKGVVEAAAHINVMDVPGVIDVQVR